MADIEKGKRPGEIVRGLPRCRRRGKARVRCQFVRRETAEVTRGLTENPLGKAFEIVS